MIDFDEETGLVRFLNLTDAATGETVERTVPENDRESFAEVARECIAAGERFRRSVAYRTF